MKQGGPKVRYGCSCGVERLGTSYSDREGATCGTGDPRMWRKSVRLKHIIYPYENVTMKHIVLFR